MCNPVGEAPLSSTPLLEALLRHREKGRVSFHTPGHKGKDSLLAPLLSLELDLTELPDTGSLYDGGDAIEQSERRAASAFGAARTLYSAGGCTLCIQTMLLLGAGPGSRVLMARNSHRSAVNAAALLDLDPVWIWPEQGRISPQQVDAMLKNDRDIRSVYITSPDYRGILCDIPALAAVCRKYGVHLLVDNAHGSHLGAFGRHPLTLGVDMTADSAHKTLPVLTGGAMLHLSERALSYAPDPKGAMALFGSTSPSFPVLASLDLAQAWWSREGVAACRKAAGRTEALRQTARQQGLSCGAADGPLADPLRLTLELPEGMDGRAAAEYFRQQGCEPEYADRRCVIFLLSPLHTEEDFERLENALRRLPAAGLPHGKGRGCGRPELSLADAVDRPPPERVLSPRQAMLCPAETVPVRRAAGRVAARAVCPCPPGVAAVVPGERLDEGTIGLLEAGGYDTLTVVRREG